VVDKKEPLSVKEDRALTPVFLQIFDLLNRREDVRKWISTLGGPPADESKDVIDELRCVEVALLGAIVSLADTVEPLLAATGAPTSPTTLARHSKPFTFACRFIESPKDSPEERLAILRKCNADGTHGSVAEVLFAKQFDGQTIHQYGLALDLLQYWELLLRNESAIPCDEFCRGVRQALCRRVTTLLRYDTLLRMPANATAAPPKPLHEAMAGEITARLERVSVRLDQIDSLQNNFRSLPETNFPRLKRQRLLFGDELAAVLSELVHLSDNTRKLMIACDENPQQLKFLEDLHCYRVAACFVNTRKHGIRGRNKTSAVADYEFVVRGEGKVIFVDWVINYKGAAWQATLLIEDLLQLWEIFLRYYTTIEFPDFRKHIGSKFASNESLSTYACKLGETIDQDLERKSSERMHYNI
jgi:hypothetical protein